MALDLYNSPFNNFVQRTYQPQTLQNRLQMAYSQAMKNKPAQWGYMISDMMPSIAEMVAYGTTKGSFNQGRIADALEREKGRRIAYNQMLRENDERQANDYVQMAKEQLGMAQADEDKAYNRELTANQIAYKKAQDEIANKLNQDKLDFMKEQAEQAQKNADRDYNLKLSELSNKPAELTEEQKLQNEINKLKAIENAKAEIAAGQDLQKANAEYEAFKSNIPNLKNLSKSSGTVVDRSIGGIAGLFSGKSNNPLTKPNDSMKEVKAQLTNAIYRANGVDGDKISKEQSKMILAQAGMPDTMNLSQSQVDTIIKNIENIYKQRISGKQNFANSFNNSVSWE